MEAEVDFSYGDLRIDKVAKEFYQSILEKFSICIRAIAGCRKKEVAFHRLIKNERFTITKMIEEAVSHSKKNCENSDHILCIQDTTELKFDVDNGRIRKGLGRLGNEFCKGFFLHPGLLVDANNYAILGLSDVIHYVRPEVMRTKKSDIKRNMSYKNLPIEEKESYRWIKLAENTKSNFANSKQITIIADRESDIYQEWDRVPNEKVNLITRAAKDRSLVNNERLFTKLDNTESSFCYSLNLSGITGKRQKRVAHIEVSYTQVNILKTKNCSDKKAEDNKILNAILVKEVTKNVAEKDRILWRILTTHNIENSEQARQIILWYSKRWLIEELFRSLKIQGINIENSQLESLESLKKISIAGLITAVKTMQLVQARDGNNRKINDVFQNEDIEILKNMNTKLEGKTEKQKNPHKEKSLAWGSWIIARLGGWMGYSCERPPGPITMKRGLEYFQKIKVGWMLLKDVCIP